jgi:hypothetical protein
MTKEQAQLFFPHSSEDDLEDLWEQRLFEQKQFFLTRPPMRKVWTARIKKLSQQFAAYLVLTDQKGDVSSKDELNEERPEFSGDFIASFHAFHVLRNQHKSAVLQAQDLLGLTNAINQWLNTERYFAMHFSYSESEQNEIEVVRSKEPDPMELLKDLKKAEKAINSSSIMALKENYNNLPESVKKEVKRLTLLAKD